MRVINIININNTHFKRAQEGELLKVEIMFALLDKG
jgi:hypothetical protein